MAKFCESSNIPLAFFNSLSKAIYERLPKNWSNSTKKGVIQILGAFGLTLIIFSAILSV
jgi:hypothetical protein